MPRNPIDKGALLDALADHVLENGLNSASLRPMAASAGTSDRMLIYHFGSKDNLILELLQFLAGRMASNLDEALPSIHFKDEASLIASVLGVMRSKAFMAYSRIWFDILSATAQGSVPHRDAAQRIVDVFIDLLSQRHPGGRKNAPRALMIIEGALVLDLVGRVDILIASIENSTG